MRSLRFTFRKTNFRLIPPVSDCLFRQQRDVSGTVMLGTWLQNLARLTCDFLV
jgi:hypothetical protein